MPEINKIPEVLYNGNQPYHVHYDNLPLKNILTRIDLVNAQVDINSNILRGCCGTAGTLNNRLSVSLKEDGSLKSGAVDLANHNIGAHKDGPYLDYETNELIDYVRMKRDERDKLELIDSEATNIVLQIEDTINSMSGISMIPSFINFDNGILKFRSSDTIFFDFEAPDIVKAHSVFPAQAAHQNIHNVTPYHNNLVSPDYMTFNVGTSFKEDSLRVYINGFRIGYGSSGVIQVLTHHGSSNPGLGTNWKKYYIDYTDPSSGIFMLNDTVDNCDNVLVDFDKSYV